MIVRPSLTDPFFLSLDTIYQRGYTRATTTYEQFTQTIPSRTKKQIQAWLDRLPKMRVWDGPRHVQNLIVQAQEIENKPFELTEAIDRYDLDDDQYGLYSPMIEMMGMQARTWPDDEMALVVEAGTSVVTFDDADFFSASHPVDTANAASGVQSNLFTTAGGDPRPFTVANVSYVRSKMRRFKGRDLKPLGVKMTTVMVPPALEDQALQMANSEFIVTSFGVNAATGSQSNILKGSFNVIVNDKLTSDTDWYGLDLSWPIKPFVWYLRKAPEFAYRTSPTDPSVFDDNRFLVGIDARGVGGYGLWFMAAKGGA